MTVLSSHPELEEFGNPLDEGIAGLRRLHEFATRMLEANDLHSVLDEILTAAEELTHADMGNLQLVDSEGALRIECQHGFSIEFLEFFGRVMHSENACGAALQQRKQVCVEDVEQSPIFAGTPALPVMLKAGARAVQSTPIVTRDGRLLGIFSTHYKTPYRPAESDLRLVSLLAAQAANLIERFRAEEQLRQAQQELVTITENMPAAVARCSRDFRCLWVSPAYAARLGLTREAITGRPIREVFGEWAFRQILPYFERVLSGERVEYTTRLDVASIGEKWVHGLAPCFETNG